MKRAAGVVALGVLACGCARQAPAPPLPPLVLRAVRQEIEQIAASGPAAPDAARRAELLDLAQIVCGSTPADARLRTRAERTLAESPDAPFGVEALLQDADAAVRAAAVWQLAERKALGAVPALVLRLKYEKDPRVRLWLGLALAHLGNGAGLADIGAAFGSADLADEAGQGAVALLQAAGQKVPDAPSWAQLREQLAALEVAWRTTASPLVTVAATPGQQAQLAARLARHLLDTDGFQLRNVDDARFVLARVGTAAAPLLHLALAATETYLRQHALEVVQALGAPARPFATQVLALLADPATAATAILALGALGLEPTLPHLLARLDAADADQRCAAAAALGAFAQPEVVRALRARIRASVQDIDLAVQAAGSLARIERGGEGLAFLEERRAKADYHAPTLAELIDRATAARR